MIRARLTLGVALALGLATAACAPVTPNNGGNNSNHTLPDGGQNTNDASTNNNNGTWIPPVNSRVYVNSRDTLYYIDPGVSQALITVGDFVGPCTSGSGFYDIAVDENQNILAIAAEALYWVDPDTAACTLAFTFPTGTPHFFSLSYVKGVDPADLSGDRLIAASAEDGEWVLIDFPGDTPVDILYHLGYYVPGTFDWRSSGDIVSVQTDWTTYQTYATVKCENYTTVGCESDILVSVNPQTGLATEIGPTGYQQIFGLGFWGDRLYGFTNDGEYITINKDTGQGTLVQQFAFSFWGAGNTTIPHVVK